MVGKVRVMIACLAVTILAMLASGLATNFSILLGARIVAGIAAGGIFPVGIAVIGDLVPVKERQVAIGRWLTAVITGNLLGSSLAGVIGDLTGWRGVFFVITALGVLAIGVAIVTLRKAVRARPMRLSLSGFSRGYGSVFANPRAKVCFGAVFVEGIVIFGLFPFIALLLYAAGETRATIAGVVIAGFSLGGVVYALTVPMLVARWRPDQLMIGGGVTAAFALALVSFNLPWAVQFAAFTLLGFGFYSMHASIQVQATELSSTARGAAMSLHSFFFFVGHASGPVLYGLGFVKLGSAVTLTVAALIAMAIGLVTARLLRERTAE
jgi:predicted MFS family arabinose efflux permease